MPDTLLRISHTLSYLVLTKIPRCGKTGLGNHALVSSSKSTVANNGGEVCDQRLCLAGGVLCSSPRLQGNSLTPEEAHASPENTCTWSLASCPWASGESGRSLVRHLSSWGSSCSNVSPEAVIKPWLNWAGEEGKYFIFLINWIIHERELFLL